MATRKTNSDEVRAAREARRKVNQEAHRRDKEDKARIAAEARKLVREREQNEKSFEKMLDKFRQADRDEAKLHGQLRDVPRPTEYTDDRALELCERIATTSRSLAYLCDMEGMPSVRTVMRWRKEHPEFDKLFNDARELQADFLADDALEIADTQEIGERTKIGFEGLEVVREDMLGHRRLRIETRKWMAERLNPKRYGNRLALAGVPGQPIGIDADAMTDEQLAVVAAQGKPDKTNISG